MTGEMEILASKPVFRKRLQFLPSMILIFTSVIYVALNSSFLNLSPKFNYKDAGRIAKNQTVSDDEMFLLNTPTCRILNIKPFNKQMLPFLSNKSKLNDCPRKHPAWTYVENTNLFVNKTAICDAGLSQDLVSCCYRSIERVEQSLNNYTGSADRQIRMSQSCKAVHSNETNPLTNEFIRVECGSKVFPRAELKYFFHAVPQLTNTPKLTKKLEYWKGVLTDANKAKRENFPSVIKGVIQSITGTGTRPTQNTRLPPNVILLGMDSMSRLQFHRYMRKTKKYLESIGAVEMRSYSKVGRGTFYNMVAVMSGYNISDLGDICMHGNGTKNSKEGYYSRSTAQDLCPYIWNKFNEANYLTSYSEDGNTFQYIKTGFVKQPTDYYFRTLELAIREKFSGDHLSCAGSQTTLEVIMKFVNDSLVFAKRKKAPIFIYNFSDFAHDNHNLAGLADEFYHRFLTNIDLANTILFVFGDHGVGFGSFRRTFHAWLEEKLPAFWVYLSERIRHDFPTWLPALQRNAGRLTCHFDFHHTLVHILTTFTPVKPFPDAKSFLSGIIIPRRHGHTLFEDVPPMRNCQEAGVPRDLCPCGALHPVPTNSSRIITASRSAINHINKQLLPEYCARLRIRNITSGAMIHDLQDNSTIANSTYPHVVVFETSPGGFSLEATVYADSKLKKYNVMSLTRINKINKSHVGCVKNALTEKICYCLENSKVSPEMIQNGIKTDV